MHRSTGSTPSPRVTRPIMSSVPAAGDWGGIFVAPSTNNNFGVGMLNFDYVTMRYGGNYYPYYGIMVLLGGAASINHSTIEKGAYTGISIYRDVNSNPTVTIQ